MSGKVVSKRMLAKHEHLRAKSVKALRAGWSVGAVGRAHEVPASVVTVWRDEAGIEKKPAGAVPRRTPEVGEELT